MTAQAKNYFEDRLRIVQEREKHFKGLAAKSNANVLVTLTACRGIRNMLQFYKEMDQALANPENLGAMPPIHTATMIESSISMLDVMFAIEMFQNGSPMMTFEDNFKPALEESMSVITEDNRPLAESMMKQLYASHGRNFFNSLLPFFGMGRVLAAGNVEPNEVIRKLIEAVTGIEHVRADLHDTGMDMAELNKLPDLEAAQKIFTMTENRLKAEGKSFDADAHFHFSFQKGEIRQGILDELKKLLDARGVDCCVETHGDGAPAAAKPGGASTLH